MRAAPCRHHVHLRIAEARSSPYSIPTRTGPTQRTWAFASLPALHATPTQRPRITKQVAAAAVTRRMLQSRWCAMVRIVPVSLPPWLEQLRRSEIANKVQNDPRSTRGLVLGVDPAIAQQDVAGWGQADFDEPWGGLSADDRVLLYSYFFQKGHLEELTEAFRMLLAAEGPKDEPILVDLGCGPFTSGLAFAAADDGARAFDYIGLDRSTTMCRTGEAYACAADTLRGVACGRRHWTTDLGALTWSSAPGWRPVFVIVSYLLASPTLDANQLIRDLERLLEQLGRGPVTVLYTNSKRADANRSFETFRAALEAAGFVLFADDVGAIEIDRWGGTQRRELRYALFHRQERDVLTLKGD